MLEETSFFPEETEYTSIEDYILWLRLSTKIDFLYIRQPLLKYYDDPKSSIRIFYEEKRDIQMAAFENFVKWLNDNKIQLKSDNKKQFATAYKEVSIRKKLSLYDKLKQRVKKNNHLSKAPFFCESWSIYRALRVKLPDCLLLAIYIC